LIYWAVIDEAAASLIHKLKIMNIYMKLLVSYNVSSHNFVDSINGTYTQNIFDSHREDIPDDVCKINWSFP